METNREAINKVDFEQIVRECVFAVACAYDHYCDEGLSEEGFDAVYKALEEALPGDTSGIAYRESFDPVWAHFRSRIIYPIDWSRTDDYFNPVLMEERFTERGYFLRDDRPIREGVKEFEDIEEAYSLFHRIPSLTRLAVYGGPREWAVWQAYKRVFH